jgi:DNA-directed RNA polymerase specialized sigma24 family protein
MPASFSGPAVADHAAAVADRDYLLRALAGLPPRQRAVLVLRYFDDLSEAETAQMLGCSLGTVKSQAAQAMAKLREAAEPGTSGLRSRLPAASRRGAMPEVGTDG